MNGLPLSSMAPGAWGAASGAATPEASGKPASPTLITPATWPLDNMGWYWFSVPWPNPKSASASISSRIPATLLHPTRITSVARSHGVSLLADVSRNCFRQFPDLLDDILAPPHAVPHVE